MKLTHFALMLVLMTGVGLTIGLKTVSAQPGCGSGYTYYGACQNSCTWSTCTTEGNYCQQETCNSTLCAPCGNGYASCQTASVNGCTNWPCLANNQSTNCPCGTSPYCA